MPADARAPKTEGQETEGHARILWDSIIVSRVGRILSGEKRTRRKSAETRKPETKKN
jgi:hypothetical protein